MINEDIFCIQDTGFPDSKFFHELLLTVFDKKQILYGAGTYAFVSKSGVNLLFSDDVFTKYISGGTADDRYHLIVGTDDITDSQAIDALATCKRKHPKFKIQAYVHPNDGTLYHPKYSWFRTESGGFLIIGSSNLTLKALRNNKESFSLIILNPEEIDYVESTWNHWIESSKENIFDIESSEVIDKCKDNHPYKKEKKKSAAAGIVETTPDQTDIADELSPWFFNRNSSVLVAEVPKAGNRWKQMNMTKDLFHNYFGQGEGEGQYRLLTCMVKSDGSLSEPKSRPLVSVKSQNYRIELDIPNTSYPSDGTVICIFVKISNRNFIYQVLFPGDEGHQNLATILESKRKGNKKVRELMTVSDFIKIDPQSKLLNYCTEPKEDY